MTLKHFSLPKKAMNSKTPLNQSLLLPRSQYLPDIILSKYSEHTKQIWAVAQKKMYTCALITLF